MYRPLFFVGIAAQIILAAPPDFTGERICKIDVFERTCSKFFNCAGASASTIPSAFPNARNQSYPQALREFVHFYPILLDFDSYCSYLLHSFLCIHYFPPCTPEVPPDDSSPDPSAEPKKIPLVVPCRGLCELATSECLDHVYETYPNLSRPEHLICTNFPSETPNTDFIVACPKPAVHFEFCLPFGEKDVKVPESDDSTVEVCVKLASTGCDDSLRCPVTIHLTFEDLSAEGGEDYRYNSEDCTNLVFEAGSIKGNRKCCEIEIENDDLVEETEIFLVHARVHEEDCGRPEIQIQCLNDCGSGEGRDSGSGKGSRSGDRRLEDSGSGGSGSEGCETKTVEVINVQFGGSIDKCTGTLKVNILDDDVCFINPKHCTSRTCRQKLNADSETFTSNNYTYAAKVELLGVGNFGRCTGVDVRIIQCWEIKKRHCLDRGQIITIPTCPGCPRVDPLIPGNQYLIAGVRQTYNRKKINVLPNLKKTGLFGFWKRLYEDVIEDWIRAAVLQKS